MLTWIKNLFSKPSVIRHLEGWMEKVEQKTLSVLAELVRCQKERDDWKGRYESLRTQLLRLRVSQSTTGRAGWEVMCFLPEEIIDVLKREKAAHSVSHHRWLVERVTKELVDLAISGVVRVSGEGKVSALIFEPLDCDRTARAPRYAQALWDSYGEFKRSDKRWDKRSEEDRVKSAAGCAGCDV